MSWIITEGLFPLAAVAETVGCCLVLLRAARAVQPWVLAGTVLPGFAGLPPHVTPR
jgi:hypothetical protein